MASFRHGDINDFLRQKVYTRDVIKGCIFIARGLGNKFYDLEALAASEHHISSGSESWSNREKIVYLAQYKLLGYLLLFSCERTNREGREFLFSVKASLHPTVIGKKKIM